MMSVVNLSVFFEKDNVMHRISPACVNLSGFEGQEVSLVYAASALVWLFMPAMIYTIAEILCPKGGLGMLHGHSMEAVLPLSVNNIPIESGESWRDTECSMQRVSAAYQSVVPGLSETVREAKSSRKDLSPVFVCSCYVFSVFSSLTSPDLWLSALIKYIFGYIDKINAKSKEVANCVKDHYNEEILTERQRSFKAQIQQDSYFIATTNKDPEGKKFTVSSTPVNIMILYESAVDSVLREATILDNWARDISKKQCLPPYYQVTSMITLWYVLK
jgi:hypothetical protein